MWRPPSIGERTGRLTGRLILGDRSWWQRSASRRRRWGRVGSPRGCTPALGRAGQRRNVRAGSAGVRNRRQPGRPGEKLAHRPRGSSPRRLRNHQCRSVRRPGGLGRSGIVDELEITDVLEFVDLRRQGVRRGPRGLVGEPAVGEDLLDDVGLGRLDEADDLHRGPAAGGVRFILHHLADDPRRTGVVDRCKSLRAHEFSILNGRRHAPGRPGVCRR